MSGTPVGVGSFGFRALIFVQSPRQVAFWNWGGLASGEGRKKAHSPLSPLLLYQVSSKPLVEW